ncbi:5-bromo-4-chloroindolyl phosphate hydrolysis family protein [uncultured Marivita sp.]|uniref:5-bromo-4-chloroindolyl phosphate hydrolysis family protein n=1 Tax=uncultured Marivita sp. TaxID=888080 RepID=UPI00261E572D|nr:5-bromo-4-chloroindolyl phosphate hydrolysis family protein [uncultured Marivita sp.]
MAQRYGGKYSPDGSSSDRTETPTPKGFKGATVDPVGARSNILFIPPIILAFTSINEGAIGMGLGLVGAGVLLLGAWLLRGGLTAEAAYNARKVARRPAFPRKMAAALMTGAGVGIAAFANEPGLIAPVIYGVAAGALHIGAFGIDPLRNKGMEGIDTFQQDRVARAVDEAEAHLAAMRDAIARSGDRRMIARVEQFQTTAKDLFRTVEDDPRDLTGAKKYLSVYLMGARDATIKFADVYARTNDPQARADYESLLDDLEKNFSARTRKMLLDDRSDLTVEIDVLRDRLKREGVRIDRDMK